MAGWARLCTVLLVLLLVLPAPAMASQPNVAGAAGEVDIKEANAQSTLTPQDARALLSSVSGSFTENLGQKGEGAGLFYCIGEGLSVALGAGWMSYDYIDAGTGQGVLVRIDFEGAADVRPVGVSPLAQTSNYITGKNRAQWVIGARSFAEVVYPGLYDGIDLRYRFEGGMLKYEFVVDPDADTSQIRLRYSGQDGLRIDPLMGNLIIQTSVVDLVDQAPISFNPDHGQDTTVGSRFALLDRRTLGFEIPGFNPSLPLIIDPGLTFSTFIGGNSGDGATFRVDDSGDVYLAGMTSSADFPVTPGAYIVDWGPLNDTFACKLRGDGSGLVFSTYVVTDGDETIRDLLLTEDKDLILVGYTDSSGLPTTSGALQPSSNGMEEGFILELSGDGTSINWATYLGGQGCDVAIAVRRLSTGDLVVAGTSNSSDFPTVSGWCSTYSDKTDAFVVRMSDDGRTLVASTFVGGTGPDSLIKDSLAVDAKDDIFIGITTCSADINVTPNALMREKPAIDVLDVAVYKLSSDLSTVIYSTYLGGHDEDWANALFVDDDGCAYVAGATLSLDFPTTLGAYSPFPGAPGEENGFITKLSPDGSSLVFSTYLGGGDFAEAQSIQLIDDGNIAFAMNTSSTDLPTTEHAISATNGGMRDLYLGVLNISFQALVYGSYLGGMADEGDYAHIHVNGTSLTVVSQTNSSNYPTTPGAFQTTFGTNWDIAVSRLDLLLSPPAPTGPPRNLMATLDNGTVRLQWDPPAGADVSALLGYELYRGLEPGSLSLIADIAPNMTGATDTPDGDGAEYTYELTSRCAFGESPRSNDAKVLYIRTPGSPLGLSVEAGCGTVSLSWSLPDGPLAYPVLGHYILRGTDLARLEVVATIGNVTSYVDRDVVNGQLYHYQVCCFNLGGRGDLTDVASALPTGPPSEPRMLRAVAGIHNITLSWMSPTTHGGSPILGYRVLRGPDPASLEPVMDLGPETTLFVDEGLTDRVARTYSVVAFSALGAGSRASAVTASPITAPLMPTNFKVIVGFQTATLTWGFPLDDGGMSVRGMIVHRGTSADDLLAIARLDPSVTSYTDTSPPYRQPLYYSVSAYNDVGDGILAAVIVATPMTLPDPPQDPIATAKAGLIALSWNTPRDNGASPVQGYVVFKGLSPDDLGRLATVNESSMSYEDRNVVGGVVYYYSISTLTAMGQGPRGSVVMATALRLPSAPIGPSYRLVEGKVTLSWSAPASDGGKPLVSYRIYRWTDAGSMELLAVVSEGRSYIDGTVAPNVTYFYAIVAVNADGEGARSDVITVHPAVPVLPPGPPVDVKAVAKDGAITLTWRHPESDGGAPVTGYAVYRGSSPADLVWLSMVGAVLEYRDGKVSAGRTYYYAIVALNSAGEGARSPVVAVEVPEGTGGRSYGPPLLWLGAAATGAVLIILAAAVLTETMRYSLVLLALPLFTRFKRDQVLDNKNRYSIHGLIIDNPGINFAAILEELGLPMGVITYHLDVLERENYVRSVRDGRLKRFFTTDTRIPKTYRMSPEDVRDALVDLVRAMPGISQKEIIREIGIDRETVGYHLRELVRTRRLRDSKVGRYTVYWADGRLETSREQGQSTVSSTRVSRR